MARSWVFAQMTWARALYSKEFIVLAVETEENKIIYLYHL